MAPGPLPEQNTRRRNAPTIPTTNLPLSGRKGDPPDVPEWAELGRRGRAWWAWAWLTPQACAWGDAVGMEPLVARRASLEDDLGAVADVEGIDFDGLTNAQDVKVAVGRVAALASGRLQILREMREVDDRLGLSPKSMAQLRWKIVDDTATEQTADPSVPNLDDRRSRLTNAS